MYCNLILETKPGYNPVLIGPAILHKSTVNTWVEAAPSPYQVALQGYFDPRHNSARRSYPYFPQFGGLGTKERRRSQIFTIPSLFELFFDFEPRFSWFSNDLTRC